MASHFGEQARAVARRFESASQHGGGEIANDGGPCALDPLTAVERIFAGHALCPAIDAVAVGGEQQDAAGVGASQTRLQERDERRLNLAARGGFALSYSEDKT